MKKAFTMAVAGVVAAFSFTAAPAFSEEIVDATGFEIVKVDQRIGTVTALNANGEELRFIVRNLGQLRAYKVGEALMVDTRLRPLVSSKPGSGSAL